MGTADGWWWTDGIYWWSQLTNGKKTIEMWWFCMIPRYSENVFFSVRFCEITSWNKLRFFQKTTRSTPPPPPPTTAVIEPSETHHFDESTALGQLFHLAKWHVMHPKLQGIAPAMPCLTSSPFPFLLPTGLNTQAIWIWPHHVKYWLYASVHSHP